LYPKLYISNMTALRVIGANIQLHFCIILRCTIAFSSSHNNKITYKSSSSPLK
jgi:hypothetical protein